MGLTYFKRYRMEVDLERRGWPRRSLPADYRLIPWKVNLLSGHAESKYQSFRDEIDAEVFPCLGELSGCLRLMEEIRRKEGFLPEATWLLEYQGAETFGREYCGTVQGIQSDGGYGGIQNLGVTPHHRGKGLGKNLLQQALAGFRRVGLSRAYLEVTAQNRAAIRLYEQMGFSKARTLYKAVEVACTT